MRLVKAAASIAFSLALAAPATATSTEMIAARAARVSASQVAPDEWPFETLPPALQTALRHAVLAEDVEGALGGLAPVLQGDRTAAAAVVASTLEVLIDRTSIHREVNFAQRLERLEDELLAALESHPASEEVIAAVGLFYGRWPWDLPAQGDRLIERVTRMPEGLGVALPIALRLPGHSPLRETLLAAGARNSPPSLEVLEEMIDLVGDELRRAALLEEAMTIAARTAPERLADFARRRIVSLLSAGAADAAIEAFREAPAATRSSILEGEQTTDGDGLQLDRRLDLAAAFALKGDAEDARELLAAVGGRHQDDQHLASDEDAEAILTQALDLLLTARASPEDPFALFAMLALATESRHADLGSRGTVLQALSELALRERYSGFARFFLVHSRPLLRSEASAGTEEDVPFQAGFPGPADRAAELSGHLRRRLDALAEAVASSEPADPSGARIHRNLARPPLDPFRVLPLPEGVRTGSRGSFEQPPGLRLPKDLAILRAEQEGSEAVLVGIPATRYEAKSARSDGYWIVRSNDGGVTWTRFDTGLLALRPYEVVERSALRLRTEGGVRVEVRLRELDEVSITAPAIEGGRKLKADGLYLEIPWEALARDRDGDGLTDLMEQRLITDLEDPDTDGDGVTDAQDPLPTVPFSAAPSATAEALTALLARIQDEDARTIVSRCPDEDPLCFGRASFAEEKTHFIIVANRGRWTGVNAGQRTIVLEEDEIEAVEAKLGVLSAATWFSLVEVDRAGEAGIAIWTERWTGMSATMYRGDDGWVVEIHVAWIA